MKKNDCIVKLALESEMTFRYSPDTDRVLFRWQEA